MPKTKKWHKTLIALALLLPLAAAGKITPAASRTQALLQAAAQSGEVRRLETALPTITIPGLQALARARVAASRLDASGAERALRQYWKSGDRNPARDAIAWSIAADNAFAQADYGQAAKATQAWLALLATNDPDRQYADVAQSHGIASLLASFPPQAVITRNPVSVPMRHDKAGLLRIAVQINGSGQSAVLDTGANISVLSRSAAQRLGVHILGAAGSVASSSRNQVATQVGIAKRLQIAGVTLSNVAFLVLADKSLEMPLPGGYKIDAIVGFPVLKAIGRMRYGRYDFAPLPHAAAAAAAASDNLHAIGNALYVDVKLDGIRAPLLFDTGAPSSALSNLFARCHPKTFEGLARHELRSAGAGGAIKQQSVVWKNVHVDIDGQRTTLPKLPVVVSKSNPLINHAFGTLGLDVLDQFGAFTLDLENMRLTIDSGPIGVVHHGRPELRETSDRYLLSSFPRKRESNVFRITR